MVIERLLALPRTLSVTAIVFYSVFMGKASKFSVFSMNLGDLLGSLTVIKSKNIGKPLKYGFLFVKFLFLYVVCVVIMI